MKSLKLIFHLLKIDHWVKNLYLFAPVFFAGQFMEKDKLLHVFAGFIVFSLAASFIYIVNDLLDAESDRQHPAKRKRPIASGAINKQQAISVALVLALLVAGSSFILPGKFLLVVSGYVILNLAYSFGLKHFAIVDISIISFGFVLRVTAGGVLASVLISHWLIIMIYLLSMFLALAKRRDDLVLISNNEAGTSIRKAAAGYSLEFAQAGLVSMATIMVVCYIMYITSPEITERLHTQYAYFNTFFVVAGVLKYLQIIFMQKKAGSPVKVILKERFIQACVLLWLLSFAIMLYVL